MTPIVPLPEILRKRLPAGAVLRWRRFKARRLIDAYAAAPSFADEPVDLRRLPVFRRESFPDSGPRPWLDRDDAEEAIARRLEGGEITAEEAELCRRWHEQGFLVLEGFHGADFVDRVWDAVERAVRSGTLPVDPELLSEDGLYQDRLLDPHLHVPEIAEVLRDEPTLRLLALLLGRPIRPFQSLAFYTGSEQLAHSDSVHMTTYPEGYLAATWTAMEDIHEGSGVLVYYPGSHRLPYYMSRDAGIGIDEVIGDFYGPYHGKYEPFIQEVIRRQGLEPAHLVAKKGDMLIWHANLLHGGTARRDRGRSRKSIVCHYFAEGAICYHDAAASLARIDEA